VEVDLSLIVFFIISAVTLLAGIGVVAYNNPIHSALSLIAALLGVSGIFATLGAHFLFAAQIIVYAGAIVVLVLFVLMLLNVKNEARSPKDLSVVAFSILGGVVLLGVLVPVLLETFKTYDAFQPLGIGSTSLNDLGTVATLGKVLYTKYLVTFESASILIMVGIAGAILVARRPSNQ
jgi:NADH-quinone oxidoreductase subunit J